MRPARAVVPAVLALLVLLVLPAGDARAAGARLEGVRHVGPTGDWKAIFAWADQLEKTRKLERRHARTATPPRVLAASRKTLAECAKPLGKAWPMTWDVRPDRARHDSSGSAYLLRLDPPGRSAQVTPADRSAIVLDLDFVRQVSAGLRPATPLKLVPTDAKPRKILGFPCREFRIEGRGKGEVWVTTPDKKILETLRAFFTAADRQVGGYPGSILRHAVIQGGGVPVLARFEGVKGPTLGGNSLGAATVLCFHTVAKGVAKAEAFDVPEGYRIVRLPPR